MTRRPRRRSFLLLGLVALIAAALSGSAGSRIEGAGVVSYTGCLDNPSGTGKVYYLVAGDTPQQPCQAGDTEIHLSGGDVTAVLAGAGLTGGGTSGVVALNLAAGYRLPQGCANGNTVKRNGSGWACLDLSTPGTINDPANPVDLTKLKGVPADLADGIDNVNERPGLPAASVLTTIDTAGDLGRYTSITVGADGLGLISYLNYTTPNADLKVAHCSNAACSAATTAAAIPRSQSASTGSG